jgi:hypothetical protein
MHFFGGKIEFGFENSVVWMDLNLLKDPVWLQNGAKWSSV